MDGFFALDLWDVVIEVLRSTNNTERSLGVAPGNWCGTGDHSSNKTKTRTPTEKSNRDVDQLSNVDSCTFLKTTKLSSLSKDEVQQRDTWPEPTELRLIGCSTEDPIQVC